MATWGRGHLYLATLLRCVLKAFLGSAAAFLTMMDATSAILNLCYIIIHVLWNVFSTQHLLIPAVLRYFRTLRQSDVTARR